MFHSSRGTDLVPGSVAILNGLAPDGGLYVMDNLPHVDYKTHLDDDYKMLASFIICKYFDEFSFIEVKKLVDEAYDTFDTKEVIELKECDNAYFLELFHGPTLAFKDLALSIMPKLMKLSKEKNKSNNKTTIITATSGDTGSAALNGFKDIEGIDIFVLYPNGGVSDNQEKIMLNYQAKNAHVIAVNGNFDDCQSFLKKFMNEHKDLNLSTANSINIARLIPQIVYYYYSYIKLVNDKKIKLDEEISFVVPSGNFGDILAGFLAKNMGLPIKNLVCATNQNSVLFDYFNTNIYDKNREFYKTNSPSMDILTSSNFERLVYYMLNDTSKVKALMDTFNKCGKYELKNPFKYFYSYKSSDSEVNDYIREVYDKYNYLVDPHTACGYGAYTKYDGKEKCVIISTASIFKFPSTVMSAFGKNGGIEEMEEEFKLERPKSLYFKDNEKIVVELNDLEDYMLNMIKSGD